MAKEIVKEIIQFGDRLTFSTPTDLFGIVVYFDSETEWTNTALLYDLENHLTGQFLGIKKQDSWFISTNLKKSSVGSLCLRPDQEYVLLITPNGKLKEGESLPTTQVTISTFSEEEKEAYLSLFDQKGKKEDHTDCLQSWVDEDAVSTVLTQYDRQAVPSKIEAKPVDKQWYAGDFHTHTYYSDGASSRLENIEIGRDQVGINFFAPTEHMLFHCSWLEVEDVLILPSVELTTARGHFNIHFSDRSPFEGGLPDNEYTVDGVLALLSAAKDHGKISVNHPFMEPWECNLQELPLKWISYLELINDPTYHTSSQATESALKAWSLLWNWGWDVVGIGGSDAHLKYGDTYEGASQSSHIGDPKTWILAQKLSHASLDQALDQKSASVGRHGQSVMTNFDGDNLIGVREEVDSVELCYQFFAEGEEEVYHQWVIDGEVIDQVEGSQSSRHFSAQEGHWIRVDTRSAANHQLLATLNPFRIKPQPKQQSTWGDLLQAMDIHYKVP